MAVFFVVSGHEAVYETQTVIQLFCPNDGYIRLTEPPDGGFCVVSERVGINVSAALLNDGIPFANGVSSVRGEGAGAIGRSVKESIFRAFVSAGYDAPPWGILTGIRPAKIAAGLLRGGYDERQAAAEMETEYLVGHDKAVLCAAVARRELDALKRVTGAAFYCSVPFCPSRCLYCSFTSSPISRYIGILPDYMAAFENELRSKRRNAPPSCAYIGGGTPAALPVDYLDRFMGLINEYSLADKSAEYTVEAGRPDAIDAAKLRVMKERGATRISVNPQTLNDATLRTIGRNHTSADFFRAFETAREAGFGNINVDLILGLPGEDETDVTETLKRLEPLRPESVTAHTLYVKRASDLNRKLNGDLTNADLTAAATVGRMVDLTAEWCAEQGLNPYYMYRQKNALGNFENVGYAKEGFECLYNAVMMEETQSVTAAGAGSAEKTVTGEGERIERTFNPKGIEEYIRLWKT